MYLNSNNCHINNLAQEIILKLKVSSLSAVELARELHPEHLKDSQTRPGLPLRRLLRSGKIIGSRQVNGRWVVDLIAAYKKVCSVSDVQQICGYSNPKSIYDRVHDQQIPFHIWTTSYKDENLEQIYFIEDEIRSWIDGDRHGDVISEYHAEDDSTDEIRRIKKIREALPENLRHDLDFILQTHNKKSTPEVTFTIPEGSNRITSRDVQNGIVRITRGIKPFFPQGTQIINVDIDGDSHPVKFQDREGGDRARSHVLHLGRDLIMALQLEAGSLINVRKISETHFEFNNKASGNRTYQKTNKNRNFMVIEESITSTMELPGNEDFRLVGTLGELLDNGLPAMDDLLSCGNYRIHTPDNYKPDYLDVNASREAGNVVNPWAIERLKEKWVPEATIVYIGLAGARSRRTLRRRLMDLIRHGRGQTTDRGPHKGGEILWQLKGFEMFTLWVSPTGDPPIPRKLERQYLADFVRKYGKLPFANRQF